MRSRILALGAVLACLGVSHQSHAQAPTKPAIPVFRLCTGSPAGGYHSVIGVKLREQARGSVDVQLVPGTPGREGSKDNFERAERKECDGLLTQSDAFNVVAVRNPAVFQNYELASSDIYKEALHLICNKETGISRITGLKKGMTVQIGPDAGGTATTWDNLVIADKGTYGPVGTGTLQGQRAANAVVDQDANTACMMYVIAPGAPRMAEINDIGRASNKLALVSTDDRDLLKLKNAKGKPVYQSVEVGGYSGLQRGSIHLAAVSAQLAVRTDWIDANPTAYDDVIRFINRAIPAIRTSVGQ